MWFQTFSLEAHGEGKRICTLQGVSINMSRDIFRRAPTSQEKIYIEIFLKYLCTFLMISHSISLFWYKMFSHILKLY